MTSREIFEMAVNVEEDGERFYRYLSEHVKDPELKKFFDFMANEERRHAERFREIAQSVGMDEAYLDSDEAMAYLKEIVSGRIFPRYDDMVAWIEGRDFQDMVNYSLSMEKETVIFYLELRSLLRGEREKEMVEKIIDEERNHIRMLTRIKKEGLS